MSSKSGNGKVESLDTEGMDISDKLDLLIEAHRDLVEQISELREEVAEKFDNLNLPGADFSLEEN